MAPYVSYTPKAQEAGEGGAPYTHHTPKAQEAFRLGGAKPRLSASEAQSFLSMRLETPVRRCTEKAQQSELLLVSQDSRFEGWSQAQRSAFQSFPSSLLTELARAASPCVNDPGFIGKAFTLITTTKSFKRLIVKIL